MRNRLLRHMLPMRGPTVCPSACRLSQSCTLLKPLDVMRYHLAGTLVWSETRRVYGDVFYETINTRLV